MCQPPSAESTSSGQIVWHRNCFTAELPTIQMPNENSSRGWLKQDNGIAPTAIFDSIQLWAFARAILRLGTHRVGTSALIVTLSLNLYWTKWSRRIYSSQLCNRFGMVATAWCRSSLSEIYYSLPPSNERTEGTEPEYYDWYICGLQVVCLHQLFYFICAGRSHTQISHFHLVVKKNEMVQFTCGRAKFT